MNSNDQEAGKAAQSNFHYLQRYKNRIRKLLSPHFLPSDTASKSVKC